MLLLAVRVALALLVVLATFAPPDSIGGYGPTYGPTMTDQELAGLEVKGTGQSHAAKAASFPAGAHLQGKEPSAAAIAWGLISATHPEYDAAYWEECRALYSGGKRLLRNPELMQRLFPPHFAEDKLLRIAHEYQLNTDWHTRVPPIANGQSG